jgi:hypothetical protein
VIRRPALAVALALAALTTSLAAAATSPRRAADHASPAWNVLPPGQAGGVALTKNSTDQIALYEGLTRLRDNVTHADLPRYFKRETLSLAPGDMAVSVEPPRRRVTITRDRWGVPHVKGTTAEDVAFGAGWATAADRQLIMELLRGPGRIAALDAPGVNAFSLALSGRTFRPSAATEARLARQLDLLRSQGAKGRQAIRIMDAYVAGINAEYRKAGLQLAPWTRNDVVAVGVLRDPARARERLRVECDVRRLGSRRPVRRDALRRERRDVPVSRRMPADDLLRRRDDRGPAG